MSANPFAPLAAGVHEAQQNTRNGRSGRARAGGIAGGALRKAGLVDEDSGMRDVGSSGPRRATRGPEVRGVGGGRVGNTLSARMGESSSTAQNTGQGGHRARDRANPMAGRAKPPRNTWDPTVTGQAFGIRGAASKGKINATMPVADLIRNGGAKRGGRVPGGGGTNMATTQRTHNGPLQAPTGRSIVTMRKFLTSRWMAESQFLNLEAMAADTILLEEELKPPGAPGAHRDLGSVMWKLCRELFPNVTTINLAKNDFKTLVPVATLAEFLPNLKNLSLESNDIKWVRDLTFHSSKGRSAQSKFNDLNELILTGNPVHDNAMAAGNEEGYRAEVLARFPQLKMLDKAPVSQTESSFANLPSSSKGKASTIGVARGAAGAGVEVREFPLAIRNKGFADHEANGILPAFLSKYFEMFDTNRDSLRAVYSANATFSVVTSSNVPPKARSAGYHHTLPRQKDLSWRAYKEIPSHNIMTLGVRSAAKGFPRGPGAILKTILKFPKTTHPLTDASKFVVDGWIINNAVVGANLGGADKAAGIPSNKPDALLFISVQGEFQEHPSLGLRSFSRSFVVAPVVPGSTAANLGWPCVIISDQLTVRQYAGTNAWNVGAEVASATVAAGGAPTITPTSGNAATSLDLASLPPHLRGIAPAQGLSEQQHSLSIQLAAQTNLTYPFAVQCLSENNWDPTQAFNNFQALKSANSIPVEAFVS
ncbi:hypothetical protein CBS101457_001489 [Exobasidium rhododendri]|nr:hypothetical protein CBS101457_001489 [Exobasidium rhododendri]